jgi:hypothetical protein
VKRSSRQPRGCLPRDLLHAYSQKGAEEGAVEWYSPARADEGVGHRQPVRPSMYGAAGCL